MSRPHEEHHSIFPEFWIPHSALKRVDDEGECWECVYCGCPHKVLELDEDTCSFVALEEHECWESFERVCDYCGETRGCGEDCPGIHEAIKETMLDPMFEFAERDSGVVGEVLFEEGDGSGLPCWGGPYEA